MMKVPPRFSVLIVGAFLGLSGCIPIRSDVAVSGSSYSQAIRPLGSAEGITILGRVSASDGDKIADCVHDEFANALPTMRIIAPKQFRSIVGGALAEAAIMPTELSDDDVTATLRNAAASPAFRDLNIHYIFLVDGWTGSTPNGGDLRAGPPGVVGVYVERLRTTHIDIGVWNMTTGEKVTELVTDTSGQQEVASIDGLINWWRYAPTESTACKDVAGKIVRYVSGSPAE